ncbi:MAG: cystathionine gamma-synthase [Bradyrhizobium sp.]|uniref:cystathionine gamma-synthase n=1 Tax=Bradyrhizobium sp. TaxID=376 RepID=UPI001C294E64|nr:cystathionine gamma-synthase [Bradyrhizobium sp.]MBU6462134.1 cystathionine gamma-synthase [Pseudomonadota bacterium]MDE2066865.1 cystathionine gamma-synthase [Bradyrhizobium sp.]MDE2241448.1 cystathionine gamma-synthase [Bradyrhizobium sp.]MDE2471266.1 cystathionine gamma-synthase [Bradyrhizobium sp.]
MSEQNKPETIAAAHGVVADSDFHSVTPPIYLSSTFAFPGFAQSGRHEYSRTSNPSRDMLAEALAKLEGGAGAVITSSGMAAVDLVLSTVRRGDLVLAPHDCYGGTYRLLCARRDRDQFDVAFIDQGDASALAPAFARGPKLVLVETPSNPLMRVVDIREIASRARAAGAKTAVDNTFLSPALQRPIVHGADFVIHSTTKYLNGHSDVVGGAVIAANPTDVEELSAWANLTGAIGAPFDAYLTLRGLRTLFPRIQRQQQNAMSVARFLTKSPAVSIVHYPGLETHSNHLLAASQQEGFGAMLSFELRGGTDSVRRFVDAVRLFTLAESLGGVESLIAHPATMTHSGMGEEARRAAGISDSLLRLSIGLEAEIDLIAGLKCGLAAVERISQSEGS